MPTANEELMRRYVGAWQTGDVDTLKQTYSDDVVLHHLGHSPLAGDYRGKEAFFQLIGKLYELAPNAGITEVHDLLVSDNHAVALVRERFPGERRTIETNRVVVYHLAGEHITEIWTYDDDQAGMDAFFIEALGN